MRPRNAPFGALLGALAAATCAVAEPPAPRPASPEPPVTGSLRATVETLVAAAPGTTVGVAYRDLASGEQLLLDHDEVFHAASTMKVPVMMAIVLAAEAGELSLAQPVAVRNEFVSIFDGSRFAIDPTEDSDPDLYRALGEERPLEELVRRMVVKSSNLATNLVIELVGAARVEALMRTVGASTMRVLRGVEDIAAYRAGMNNTATAHDLLQALAWIAERELQGSEPARRMAEILRQQEHRSGIPAGVPEGIPVGNKTGWITAIRHDAAIVYPTGSAPYVLVVLTRGFEDHDQADRLIAAVSRAVWAARGAGPNG